MNDPGWNDLVIWSSETVKDTPILGVGSRNHTQHRVLTAEELENQTLAQFHLLKVSPQ